MKMKLQQGFFVVSMTLQYRNEPWSLTRGDCFYELCSDYVR